MNEVAKPIRQPDHFTQLLQRPRRGRMRRDVDVQQLPRCMMDEYEDVQGSKRRCDCYEEVTGDDRLRVIAQKSRPTLNRLAGDPAGFGMYFLTVRGETRIPNFTSSSLAMRSSHHSGVSLAMRPMSCRSSSGIGGRPGRDL